MRLTVALSALLTLASCASSEQPHGHDHDEGGAHSHGEASHDHGEEAHSHGEGGDHGHHASQATAEELPTSPPPFEPGEWSATLEVTAEGVKLSASDASGAAVEPTGEVKATIDRDGHEQQRVTLSPADGGWFGAAQASGSASITAVFSVEIDGQTESARVAWRDASAPAEEGHGHDEGHGHNEGHGHDH